MIEAFDREFPDLDPGIRYRPVGGSPDLRRATTAGTNRVLRVPKLRRGAACGVAFVAEVMPRTTARDCRDDS
jgi:hypothetical protein